jgi:hypothetical protein
VRLDDGAGGRAGGRTGGYLRVGDFTRRARGRGVRNPPEKERMSFAASENYGILNEYHDAQASRKFAATLASSRCFSRAGHLKAMTRRSSRSSSRSSTRTSTRSSTRRSSRRSTRTTDGRAGGGAEDGVEKKGRSFIRQAELR